MLVGELRLRIVDPLVCGPIGAKILEEFVRDRFENGRAVGSKPSLCPLRVRVLNQDIKAKEPVLDFAARIEEKSRESGPGRGNAGFAKKVVSHAVTQKIPSRGQIPQIECASSGEAPALDVARHIQFERFLVGSAGAEISAVPFESCSRVGEKQ